MNHFLVTMTDRLLTASWQGGLALGLVWLVCSLLPKLPPRLRCWLWRLAYLKLLIALFGMPAIPLPLLSAPSPPVASSPYFANLDSSVPTLGSAAATPAPASESGFPLSLRLGLLILWGLGFGIVCVRTAREWRSGQRLKRDGAPEQRPDILTACREQCRHLGIGHSPALLRSETIGSPLLLGCLAPAVVLPAALCDSCSPEELRLMLAHELAHLRRHDLQWCWLPTLAQALFWFHPLVWIANREWRVAQEIACDALALEVTQAPVGDYGATLLKVAAQSRVLFQPASRASKRS